MSESSSFYHNYSVKKNPNTKIYNSIKKKINDNEGFCPSKQEKKPYNKCPCNKLTEYGECECGLYIRSDN